MKPKIIVFKTLVAMIAITGAIASVSASPLAATSAYVHYLTDVNTYCVKCGTCDRPGQFTCVARVTVAGTAVNYNTKRAGCTAVQQDTDAAVDCFITLPIDALLIP